MGTYRVMGIRSHWASAADGHPRGDEHQEPMSTQELVGARRYRASRVDGHPRGDGH